jgi:hypothetical protein
MATKQERIAAHIANRILNNTRKRFSSLHEEALERELFMANERSSTTTTNMNVADTPASRAPVQTNKIPFQKFLDNEEAASMQRPNMDASSNTSGMNANANQIPIVVKPVDRLTIQGSYPGDSRSKPGDTAKASLDKAADNGGPRNSVGQFKSSKFETQPPFISTVPQTQDSDSGN